MAKDVDSKLMTEPITFHVSPTMLAYLKTVAKSDDRSLSSLVRILVAKGLEAKNNG